MRRLIFLAVTMLMACSDGDETVESASPLEASARQISYAQEAVPQDAAFAAIYDRSCRSCHTMPQSGAPLTGHGEAWRVRLDQSGMDGLIVSTRNGLNAMPAMGLCNDCRDDDFRALITFMSREAN